MDLARSRSQPLSKYSLEPIRYRLLSQGPDMRRREFLSFVGGAAATWPLVAGAQTPKVPRVGYLSPSSPAGQWLTRNDAFRQGLRELGYDEGKNIVIEYRFAEGKFDRLPDFAAELIGLKVDVIVAVVTQASLAARNATTTISIVMVAVSDPLGSGLVTGLQRPGGNITGIGSMTGEIVGKSLQLLNETIPNLSRVAVLWNPGNAIFQAQMLKEAEAAAGMLGVQLQTFGARNAAEIDHAFGNSKGQCEGAAGAERPDTYSAWDTDRYSSGTEPSASHVWAAGICCYRRTDGLWQRSPRLVSACSSLCR